jgi:hypothetical protein
MRFLLAAAAALLIPMTTAGVVVRPPLHRVPHGFAHAASAVTVSIVALPGGASIATGAGAYMAELGTVSANIAPNAAGIHIERRASSYIVTTEIGLRATSNTVPGPVSVQAFVDAALPGVIVRIDGMVMSQIPQTIATRVPLDLVMPHRLELEIPDRLNPALVPSSIPLEFGALPQ